MSTQSANSKMIIRFSIDDEVCSHAKSINSCFTIQQTLQSIRDKYNDQNIRYVYIKDSIIDDMDDLMSDWNDPNIIFNFRHSIIIDTSTSDNSSTYSNNYNFTVFTTANWDSLTKGESFTLDKNMNRKEFENFIQEYCSRQSHIPISQMKLFIFLPGGIEFVNTTIKEFIEILKPEKLHIYIVITMGVSSNYLTKEIAEICDIRGEMSTIFSPLTDSSDQGKQLFACLISSLFHRTIGRKEFIMSISKITGFPPLISSLKTLIKRKTITGKDLILITAPLFTIFKYLVDNSIADINILELCPKLCNLISQIENSEKVPLENHFIDSKDHPDDNTLTYIEQYMHKKNLLKLNYWKPDFEKKEYMKKHIEPFTENQLQNAWDEKRYFKPVMPLTLRHVHVSSIVYGPNNTYRLFVMDSLVSKEIEASSKADLIDPETGQTTHTDIEEFAKNVKGKEIDGKQIELIDEDSVQQITMVLIDQSGSMHKRYDDSIDLSRDSLAKQLLTSWAAKSFGYRISSLQGLISFATNINVKSELSPLIPDFEKSVMEIHPKGNTRLWDAIKVAAQKLVDKKIDKKTQKPKFKNATLRILILTDGEDTSKSKPTDVLPYLIENNIIVDVVIVSLKASCKDVCALSHLTGGLAFRPTKVEDGIALFEKEAFLSIQYREKAQPFKDKITNNIFNSFKNNLSYDKEPKNKIIVQALAKQPLLTPRAAIKGLDGTYQYRLRRIAKELRIAHRWIDTDIKVFPVENLVDRWRIYIKGPESTLYQNKWWDLFATFPEKYPYSPPIFRFITVPYHINISDEGRICMNTLGSDYSSSTNVMELIASIKALLIIPNYDDPIDIAKLTLYNKSASHYEFTQKVIESVKKAKDDIKNYLSNTIINDDTDYDVPNEIYVPAENRCPITGKPMDPANIVVASSGIRYDRDALKLLLKSSKQPRCIITHKILTDNPDIL